MNIFFDIFGLKTIKMIDLKPYTRDKIKKRGVKNTPQQSQSVKIKDLC